MNVATAYCNCDVTELCYVTVKCHIMYLRDTNVTMFPRLFLPCSVNITVKVAPENANNSTAGVTCSTLYEDATNLAHCFEFAIVKL